jgi:hypothetical protein
MTDQSDQAAQDEWQMRLSGRQQTIGRLREQAEEALRETSAARAEGRHKEARIWEARSRQAHRALLKAEKAEPER